jgi:hypothetical protein
MHTPNLFKVFLKLKDQSEMLKFANNYGTLGLTEENGGQRWVEDWGDDSDERLVDTPSGWETQIKAMHDAFYGWKGKTAAEADIEKTINEWLEGCVDVKFQRAEKHGWELATVPRSLIGALWLQLAQTIAGSKQYKVCPVCGKLFEASRGANRSDRLYCTDACKARAYRDRKAEKR